MPHITLRPHARADLIRVCLLIAVALLLPSRAHGQTTGRCMLPDPFVAFGGGTCFNGGWLPPGMPVPPSPPPASSSGGCITPDPFIALGGGTCFNGGWFPPAALPPTTPVSSPVPVTLPTDCLTPDPFAAFGGGTCVNGGWFPADANAVPTLPTSPAPGGCATPDPFASIPGMAGVCVDGGWQPTGTPTAQIQFTGVVFESTPDGPVPVAGADVIFEDFSEITTFQATTDESGQFTITVPDATLFANSPFPAFYLVARAGFNGVAASVELDFSGSLLEIVSVSVELARGGAQ